MSIEFSCEHCGKTLSTSDDKAGRKAKCPGCGETLTVPSPAAAEAGGDADDEGAGAPPPLPKSGRRTCPMCGEKTSASASKCEFCGEELEAVQEPRRRGRSPENAVPFEVGAVLSATWDAFKRDLGNVVGGTLCYGILSFAAFVPAVVPLFLAIAANPNQEPDVGMLAVAIALALPGGLVATWLYGGYVQLLLAIARGDESRIGMLFSGAKYFWRMLACGIIYNVMYQVGSQMCVLPAIVVAILFWPYAFLLVDFNLPNVQAIVCAPKLGSRVFGGAIVLFLVSVGVTLLGTLALLIGLIFAVPFCSLMWVVAYCQMVDQGGGPEDDDE